MAHPRFRLVSQAKDKGKAQAILARNLKAALKRQGTRNIGFPSGDFDATIYSEGSDKLWVAFDVIKNRPIQRYWNGFGIFKPNQPKQMITAEINIAIDSNSGAQVAGSFGEDIETGDIYLMHSGRIGGGRQGIGQYEFLVHSKAKLEQVIGEDGNIRNAIVIGKLNDPSLAERIFNFVLQVQSFKDKAVSGELHTAEFKRQVKEFEDSYGKEFVGKKRGARGGSFDYVSYHGDIVQKLYEERRARLAPGEEVFNSRLVDLLVKKNGNWSEIYEVKTRIDRQVLYTAVGQLITHGNTEHGAVAKFLVVPAEADIPEDILRAINMVGVRVRRFSLGGTVRKRFVVLNEVEA